MLKLWLHHKLRDTLPKLSEEAYFNYIDKLELKDWNYLDHSQINLLLKADILSEIVKGRVDEPVAVKSSSGWIFILPSKS